MEVTNVELQSGQRVIVMGFAKSGEAVANLLLRHGVHVTVNERRELTEGDDGARALERAGAKLVFGGHPLSLLESHPDFIVKNPGIPYSVPLIAEALRRGIPVFTEIEVASWLTEAPIYAITGSNGKTTTTTLIGKILDAAGQHPVVAGNIGRVLSGLIEDVSAEQPIVLEVSSFQLMGIDQLHPRIAVLLNLYHAHLDYHETFENYVQAKWRLFHNMTDKDTVVLNFDQEEIVSRAKELTERTKVVWFSQKTPVSTGVWIEDGSIYAAFDGVTEAVLPVSDLGLQYNLENTLAAVAVARLAGVSNAVVRQVLERFQGVEHRMERVGKVGGVEYYNDSKATNAQAALRALKSFEGHVVWIAGGLDRGDDFTVLTDVLTGRVTSAVLLGQSAERLAEVCTDAGIDNVGIAATLAEAVSLAREWARPGDVVLLSPACASWDMFSSFEERGSMFKDAVHRL